VFPVRYGQTYRVELSFKQNTGGWIMSRITIVISNMTVWPGSMNVKVGVVLLIFSKTG
jgi:hypothetical protein